MKPAIEYLGFISASFRSKIVLSLTLILFTTWGVILWSKTRNARRYSEIENTLDNTHKKKKEVSKAYHSTLQQLDALTGSNTTIQAALRERNKELIELTGEIARYTALESESPAGKKQQALLVADLMGKKERLEKEIKMLQQHNAQLKTESDTLIANRDHYKSAVNLLQLDIEQMQKKITLASTLNASNVKVTPLHIGRSNRIVSSKKVSATNRLLLTLDVQNNIIDSGTTDLVILIHDGEGNLVKLDTTNAELPYTAKFSIDVEPTKTKTIEFAWNVTTKLQKGSYHFSVYHNNLKIAECVKEVKRGRFA